MVYASTGDERRTAPNISEAAGKKELPPSDWHLNEKPVVEVDNDTFKTGPVGMMGITSGVSYFDNMVVVESIDDIDKVRPVSPRLKLTTTWGLIKTRFQDD